MMNPTMVLLAILATWRVSALLVYGRLGEGIRYKAKAHMLGEDGQSVTGMGRILSCFWCTSLAVAGFFATIIVDHVYISLILVWPAIAGGAILINHLCRINLYAEKR